MAADSRSGVRLSLPTLPRASPLHAAALAAVALLLASFLAVLYHVVDVVGGLGLFIPLVAGALGLAVVLRALPRLVALGLSVVLLAAGLGVYVTTAPALSLDALSLDVIASDLIALLTGFSVLQMLNVGTWALAVTPGPVFLTAYFALRGEYARSAAVGGAALGFFVLTGDSGTVGTLLGVVGAAGAVGFGTLAAHDAGRREVEVLAAGLALMVLASATVSAVPSAGGSPLVPEDRTAARGGHVTGQAHVGVGGAIELTPKVQFVVHAERPAYWRVAAYDRFTGSGWVRTSDPGETGAMAPPPGPTRRLEQRVVAKQSLSVMPAAADPVAVTGEAYHVTALGNPTPQEAIQTNDSYRVVSQVPVTTPAQLRQAGTDYPDEVRDRYLQVPDSVSPRVARLTANVTDGAETPYGKAALVERWLEANKNYSLTVSNPEGNVVNEFLFEMDRGYCVYYASAMVVMLRTQGVPARFVVGYTHGQRVSEDTWVVRGLDSHAWVEVYFPDVGWVRFDPTPGGPRQTAEHSRLEQARQENVSGVDTAGSQNGTWTSTTTAGDGGNETPANATSAPGGLRPGGPNLPTPPEPAGGTPASPGDDGWLPAVPDVPPETLALWSVLSAGLLAGARRTGLTDRVYRTLWLRWFPRGPPEDVIEGAYARVEYVLTDRHRRRRDGETAREYLDAIGAGERAHRVAELRERARYANEASEDAAAEAKSLARALAADNSRFGDVRGGDSV